MKCVGHGLSLGKLRCTRDPESMKSLAPPLRRILQCHAALVPPSRMRVRICVVAKCRADALIRHAPQAATLCSRLFVAFDWPHHPRRESPKKASDFGNITERSALFAYVGPPPPRSAQRCRATLRQRQSEGQRTKQRQPGRSNSADSTEIRIRKEAWHSEIRRSAGKRISSTGIGVHLTLPRGSPCRRASYSTLVDRGGRLHLARRASGRNCFRASESVGD